MQINWYLDGVLTGSDTTQFPATSSALFLVVSANNGVAGGTNVQLITSSIKLTTQEW